MSTGSARPTRRELEKHIIAKASQDEAFKQELLNQPTETIMKEMGFEYNPDGPKFQVLEETPDTLYIVLPIKREQIASLAGGEGELSDELLESVAGGARSASILMKPCEHD